MAFFKLNKRNLWGNVNMTEPLWTKLLSENIVYKILDSVIHMSPEKNFGKKCPNGYNCLTHRHRYRKRGFYPAFIHKLRVPLLV